LDLSLAVILLLRAGVAGAVPLAMVVPEVLVLARAVIVVLFLVRVLVVVLQPRHHYP
jgi:cytochrome c oxidase subunit IV